MDEPRQRELSSTVAALNRYIRAHECSDFRIKGLEGERLCLAGSFDLSYYHDVEILVTGVSHLNLPCDFWVDLSEASPFSVEFPFEDYAVLRFTDCGTCQRGEICFDGDISVCMEHISYR